MTARFEITEDHLTLLAAADFFEDDCEFGAPAMHPKRPYGNSGVVLDLAELLIPGWDDMTEQRQEDVLAEQEDRLVRVHRDLSSVLNVATSARSFKPGVYEREGREPWRLVGGPAPKPDIRKIAAEFVQQAAQKVEAVDIWDVLDLRYPDLSSAEKDEAAREIFAAALDATVTVNWGEGDGG